MQPVLWNIPTGPMVYMRFTSNLKRLVIYGMAVRNTTTARGLSYVLHQGRLPKLPLQINALGLLFHPDILRGTQLGRNIGKYTFFSYDVHEALHISTEEREIVTGCLKLIDAELAHATDRHSRTLLVNQIELLLNYCQRFYERQFATRTKTNNDVLSRFEHLLDDYFTNSLAEENGLPSVKYFADKVCLSPNYFGDMMKKETGKTPQEYIQDKIIEIAKERVAGTGETVTQIAYSLGFQYPQHFCRQFKKRVGCTPNEFRAQFSR